MRLSSSRKRGGRRFDPGPVRSFALLSVVPLMLLGLVLSATVRNVIQDRYLSTYAQTTDVTINSLASVIASVPEIQANFLKSGNSTLAQLISDNPQTASLVGVTFLDPNGKVIFSSIPSLANKQISLPAIDATALRRGDQVARFVAAAPSSVHLSGPAVELAVPVRVGKTTFGVFHAYSSATSLDQGIAAGVRRVNWILAGGLALLWLTLFPVVLSASRRLRRQAKENAHLALHDTLTGLANRDLFSDRLSKAIATSRRRGDKVGLLLLDLDRFKEVNESLGHKEGDRLLCYVAEALAGAVREQDTIARLGGDEFAIVLTGIDDTEGALLAANRVSAVLETPLDFDGVPVTPQASMGLCLFPDHGGDGATLLARADIAMYTAKANHQDLYLYEPEKDLSGSSRLGLVTELRRALRNDELVCHYQPLVRMPDKGLWGVEALVRWNHPTRGLLAPIEFLPVVEQSGLIDALTQRVLHVALAQCRAWREDGLDLVVAVNLSARSFRDAGLPEMVFAALLEAGVPPDRLELEITENSLLEDPAQAKLLLEALADGGISISLDDFGTGYSSLSYLSHLPVGKVKIDRAFLQELGEDDLSEKIVASVIDLGKRLGMVVLAEGVETVDVWDLLVAMGCPQAQGYYLARPMPGEELMDWAAHNVGGPGSSLASSVH